MTRSGAVAGSPESRNPGHSQDHSASPSDTDSGWEDEAQEQQQQLSKAAKQRHSTTHAAAAAAAGIGTDTIGGGNNNDDDNIEPVRKKSKTSGAVPAPIATAHRRCAPPKTVVSLPDGQKLVEVVSYKQHLVSALCHVGLKQKGGRPGTDYLAHMKSTQ